MRAPVLAGSGLKYLGYGAMLLGGSLIVVSFVSLGSALRVAEILYAEDFDRSGSVPAWFGPWHLAMQHRTLGVAILSAAGIALFLSGALYVGGVSGSVRWLERACWAGAVVSLLLVTALAPLHRAGRDWPGGSPAQELRRTLLSRMAIGGLESLLLVVMALAVRKIRMQPLPE